MVPFSYFFFLVLYLKWFTICKTHDGAGGQFGIGIFIIYFGFAILIGFIQPDDLSIVFPVAVLCNLDG